MPSSQGMQDLVEGLPGDELHGDIVQSGLLADAIDGHDVRVVQARRRLRLALEPLQALRIKQAVGRQHFQCDVPAEGNLLRLVDDAHAAPADLAQDAILAQFPRDRASCRCVGREFQQGYLGCGGFQKAA